MRDHTTPLWQELTSSGAETVSLTPGASQQTGVFNVTGIDPVTDGKRNYLLGVWLHATSVVDSDGAGNAIHADKLGKLMASWRLFSPLMGEVFPHRSTRGATLYHIIQVMALGFLYPQGARTVIPANTDADVTIDVFYYMPTSYEFLKKPHETAMWVGLFDQGVLEGTLDVSTVFDGDYAGAVTKATTALRAVFEYIPSPDNFLGCPVQWRDREIAGGGTQPTLLGVGQETQLNGVRSGCGLAGLFWLSDATGIGMGGPDGVDNITQIELPWRNQKLLRNLDPYFLNLRRAAGKRVGPVISGATAIADTAGWPFTLETTVANRPAANSQSMFLPIIYPGKDAETSKFQRVNGNLKVNMTNTATVSSSHRFLSLEFMEFDEIQRDKLFTAMGCGPDRGFRYARKALLDNSPDEEKLRYSRWLAIPA